MASPAFQMREGGSGRELLGTFTGQCPIWDEDELGWRVSDSAVTVGGRSVLDYLTPGRTLVQAINAAFADTDIDASEVYFPPGLYPIDGPLTCNVDYKSIRFVAGAVLQYSQTGLAQLTLNGIGAQIIGSPTVRFDVASSASYIAIDLHGTASRCGPIRFEINANQPNVTMIRLSGDYCTLGDVFETGVGTFGKLIELAHADDTEVDFVTTGRVIWQPVDDGITTRNFGTIIRYKGRGGRMGGIECNTGGRTVLDMGYDLVGHQWQIDNPEFYVLQANWGMRIRDGAEFGEVWGGIFHQSSDGVTARAGSQGIELGEGSVKLYGTKYIGFDIGCRFTGSCDSCGFFGAVFANCKTANMQIDTGVFPVSALGLHGGYMESVAVNTCIPIHLKTGEIDGMQVSGFQLSSSSAAVAAFEVDPAAVGARGVVFSGCRFPQVPGASVTRPNAGSSFLFLYNQFFGSFSISTGAFAANATSIDALANSSLATKSLTISTASLPGDPILGQWVDLFTVNFAAGIGANSFVELDLPFAEVTALNKFVVAWTGTGAAFSHGSLLFTVYLHDVGFIRIRGTNVTGVAVGAIAGSMFVTVQKVLP